MNDVLFRCADNEEDVLAVYACEGRIHVNMSVDVDMGGGGAVSFSEKREAEVVLTKEKAGALIERLQKLIEL